MYDAGSILAEIFFVSKRSLDIVPNADHHHVLQLKWWSIIKAIPLINDIIRYPIDGIHMIGLFSHCACNVINFLCIACGKHKTSTPQRTYSATSKIFPWPSSLVCICEGLSVHEVKACTNLGNSCKEYPRCHGRDTTVTVCMPMAYLFRFFIYTFYTFCLLIW